MLKYNEAIELEKKTVVNGSLNFVFFGSTVTDDSVVLRKL